MIVVILAGLFAIILLVILSLFVITRKKPTIACKRVLAALAGGLVISGLIFCGMHLHLKYRQEAPAHSLGFYKDKMIYTHGEFQDYTDYGVYTYKKVKIADNPYFKRATAADLWQIRKYLDHYESVVAVIGDADPQDTLFVNYSFDRSCLDENDYFYLDANDEYSAFGDYDLWVLDAQTGKLYYFHHNI